MKNMLGLIVEIFVDLLLGIKNAIENSARNFAIMLNVILPFLMYFAGQYAVVNRGEFAIGGEVTLPLIFGVVIYVVRSYANKIGKGTTIPTPKRRFTECSDDGEVNVRYDRLEEMLLYVADVEDWLERKNLL